MHYGVGIRKRSIHTANNFDARIDAVRKFEKFNSLDKVRKMAEFCSKIANCETDFDITVPYDENMDESVCDSENDSPC